MKNLFNDANSAMFPPLQTAAKDSLLFMWTTNPRLDQAIELGKARGFRWAAVAFVRDKMRVNPGFYTMSQCELCLVFKKGAFRCREARAMFGSCCRSCGGRIHKNRKKYASEPTGCFRRSASWNFLRAAPPLKDGKCGVWKPRRRRNERTEQ